MPLALRTILTWLVIGPVLRVFKSANGGCPSNTWVLQVSFRVNQTPEGKGLLGALRYFGLDTISTKHSLEDQRKPTKQQDEEQAIAVRELDATASLALQHGGLMALTEPCEGTFSPRVG
jgi:hypothetical protein